MVEDITEKSLAEINETNRKFLDRYKLIKLNKIDWHWLTKCEHCGNRDFKIIGLHRRPLDRFMADCKCKKCSHTSKLELYGDKLKEIIEEIQEMEDKVIFERDEFVVKENESEYFIEFKTLEGAIVKDIHTPYILGAEIPKSKYKGV